ncbi:MAG: hypothetical protein GW949_04495 [Spirochaetales bacterium]|nr:hypothetical protein [Spirochaetales bacterium]
MRTSGHGVSYKGVSISCALVTAGVKNFGKTLAMRNSLEITGSSTGPGDLTLRIGFYPENEVCWILGVQELFETLLGDAVSSFPLDVDIQESIEKGELHGS